MARKSLEELKSAFAQKQQSDGNNDWKKFFPFWKMDENTTTIVRFLPDADDDNSMGFLTMNLTHELVINGEKKKVACLSMYGEPCPICELSRKYYDEKNDDLGKKYYKKKSYIGQVLVIEAPFEYDQESTVKLIEFGPKIFKQIQAAFQSGDLENPPDELVGGYNFRIKKTKDGKFADYATSSFSPKQTNVSDEVIASLELYDLKAWRAKPLNKETLEAMLIAEQTGASFNEEKNEKEETQTSAPAQSQVKAAETKVEKPEVKAEPKVEKAVEASAPAAEAKPEVSTKAKDVLAQLKAKVAAKKAEQAA